ncbi:MAG: hypothetical protein AMJ81_01725 [Phycisphaerae bacterium SM23_33]|nr:MAG: hypothetical protein AMJ81_01725 [Phycisphaerae bacterium SM23_33]
MAGCEPSNRQLQMDPTRAYVDARSRLLQAAEDPDPRVRTHALEALAATEAQAAGPVMMQALRDDRLPVISAAVMAVGETCYAPAMPALLELIQHPGTPPKLRCVVIYALHRLGNDSYTTQLAELLHNPDKLVRAEAARVMGKMGEPSAVDLLKARQMDDPDVVVRLNIAESLAVLGDERSLGLLEGYTKSMFVEDRLIAVAALGGLRHRRSVYVLRRLVRDANQGPIVQVAAAGALARLGEQPDPEPVLQAARDPAGVLRKGLRRGATLQENEIDNLQTLALLSLEQIGDPAAVDVIHPLLRSPRGPVAVAAARAILRLIRQYRPVAAAPEPVAKPPAQPPPPTQPAATQPAPPALRTSGGKD